MSNFRYHFWWISLSKLKFRLERISPTDKICWGIPWSCFGIWIISYDLLKDPLLIFELVLHHSHAGNVFIKKNISLRETERQRNRKMNDAKFDLCIKSEGNMKITKKRTKIYIIYYKCFIPIYYKNFILISFQNLRISKSFYSLSKYYRPR